MNVGWGNAYTDGEGKGDDGDYDGVKEDVCEDSRAYCDEDEGGRGAEFEKGWWSGGINSAPAKDVSRFGCHGSRSSCTGEMEEGMGTILEGSSDNVKSP